MSGSFPLSSSPAREASVYARPDAVVICIGGLCYRLTPAEATKLGSKLIESAWDSEHYRDLRAQRR